MEFIEIDARDAVGAIAAHSVRQGEFVIKKGARITAEHVQRLAIERIDRIVVARLGADDRGEDEVAFALAERAAGAGTRVAEPFTGRANIFSTAKGVLRVDAARVDAFNMIDERITIATLPAWRVVNDGEMVATVKIIPFAVDAATVARAAAVADALASVEAFTPKRVGVISTLLPGLKAKTIKKTLQALEARLGAGGSTIATEERVAHDVAALSDALRRFADADVDLIIVFGASAVTDRRDVIPAAIERTGGALAHVGMPVDPGNLLVLGDLAGKPVIGAPGCARSPRENGFDWVLQRLLADIPVEREDIMKMGVGGLLMEIGARGQLRDPNPDEHA